MTKTTHNAIRFVFVLAFALFMLAITAHNALAANVNNRGNNMTNVSQIEILDAPSDCGTVNYFMTRFRGWNSTCTQADAASLVIGSGGLTIAKNANQSINLSVTGYTATSGQAGGTDEIEVSSSYKFLYGRFGWNANWPVQYFGATWNGSTWVHTDSAAALSIEQEQSSNNHYFKISPASTGAGNAFSGALAFTMRNDASVTIGPGVTQGITTNGTASCTSVGSLAGCVGSDKFHVTGNTTITTALRLTPTASAPFTCGTGTEGYMYSDNTAGARALCYCNSTAWVNTITAGTCT